MLSTFSQHFKDVSVLRKCLFAVAQLPKDLPNIWELAVQFATKNKGNASINAETVQLLAENLLILLLNLIKSFSISCWSSLHRSH